MTYLYGAFSSKGSVDKTLPPHFEQFKADKYVPNSVGS